jgi:hypothetical protein
VANGTVSGVKIYNNTIYNNSCGGSQHAVQVGPGGAPLYTTVQNNIFYSNGHDDALIAGGSFNTVTPDNFAMNPTFVNAGSHDFHITSASGAASFGSNLSSSFGVDFDGNPRSTTGPWSSGAYTANGVAPPDPVTTPPTAPSHIEAGVVILASGGKATATFKSAFLSATSYFCALGDETSWTRAAQLLRGQSDASHITIKGNVGDRVDYVCSEGN